MKKYRLLKLFGLALLTMVVLVVISILEVAIYSYVINPGHEASFYDEHANASAPWISCLCGFFVFFLVARYWGRKLYADRLKLVLLYWVAYIILDLVILVSFGVDWAAYGPIVLMSNAAKLAGGLLGYYLYRPKAEGLANTQ